MSNGNGHTGHRPSVPDPPRKTEPATVPAAPGLAALIKEAETLHAALNDARTRAGRLTVALRRYRRHERLVTGALASLKMLNLQEAKG